MSRKPELIDSLRGYSPQRAVADITAGVIVGIVAVPLAIASGLPPEYGLYTGIVAGFLISALGGSRVQIGGPTGAFVVIVYGIVQQHGVAGLTVATIMAGVMLVLMGLAKFGGAIKWIPYPVTLGFTTGIAILIATQYPALIGITVPNEPSGFLGKIEAYARATSSMNPSAVAVGLATIVILVVWPRLSRRIPGPIIALIAGTVAVWAFGLDVETIGSRFGEIRFGVPRFQVPELDVSAMRPLLDHASPDRPLFSVAGSH